MIKNSNKEMNPLVSVVITTKNEEVNIQTCLQSVKNQSYRNIEILVIDNNSSDNTKNISKKFTPLVFNKGPERSVQRNFGSVKANGKYILFLDADMKLSSDVIDECVIEIEKDNAGGVIIPEESYGVGFWAQCKKLERSFYVGNDHIEAARFFRQSIFKSVGGFDSSITGPEDWDLSQKVEKVSKIVRIQSYIYHNEGKLSLINTVRKKYYYSKKFAVYMKKKENKQHVQKQFSIIDRYALFFSHPRKLFHNPFVGLGMLIMKSLEFFAGSIGFLISLK